MPLFPTRTIFSVPRSLALAAALCALAACDKTDPTGPVATTKLLSLTSPATGAKLKGVDSLAVKWTVKDDATGAGRLVSAVDILLSTNGGQDWGTLNRSGSVKPTSKQWMNYKWPIADSIYIQDLNKNLPLKGSHTCLVIILDYALKTDPDLADTSGVFSIDP